MALKQSTLNEKTNAEALSAYAERLVARAARERDRNWLDNDPEAEEIADALVSAAETLTSAAEEVREAERAATDAAYARLYGRTTAT